MRKNVVLLLVALSCATSMFGQNNTDNIAADIRRLELYPADISTASQKNLKGIVFSVTHGIYEYKENFGDPAPGNLEQGVVTMNLANVSLFHCFKPLPQSVLLA